MSAPWVLGTWAQEGCRGHVGAWKSPWLAGDVCPGLANRKGFALLELTSASVHHPLKPKTKDAIFSQFVQFNVCPGLWMPHPGWMSPVWDRGSHSIT